VPDERPARRSEDELPIDDIIDIQGDALPDEQDAVIDPDQMERARPATRTELDRGYTAPDLEYAEGDAATLDGLDLDDLREGETDDPSVATEEGLTYVPPTDPPASAHDGDLTFESDMTERIRAALRSDAATNGWVDRLVIGTRGSLVVVRGVVDGIEDSDAIVEVIERVDGVETVIDQTEVGTG
jgi:hypothetical protein